MPPTKNPFSMSFKVPSNRTPPIRKLMMPPAVPAQKKVEHQNCLNFNDSIFRDVVLEAPPNRSRSPGTSNLTSMFEDSMVSSPYQERKIPKKGRSFMRPTVSHKPYTKLDMTKRRNDNIEIIHGDTEVVERGQTIIKDLSAIFDESNFITTQDLLEIDKKVEEELRNQTNSPQLPVSPREIPVEELFPDPFFGQSSQRFLSDFYDTNVVLPNNKSQESTSFHKITTNPLNCSQYVEIRRMKPVAGAQCIERQRNMHKEYEEQINDDLLGNSFSECLSSQYHREMMRPFDELEQTITNMSNAPTKTQEQISINWSTINGFPPSPLARSPQPSTSNAAKLNSTSKDKKKPLVLKTAILKPVSSNFFGDYGPFFGLPILAWNLIKEYKQITELYDWQEECLQNPAIPQRNNLVYSLPTSGGKTLVAEILILREIICRRRDVIFILPYVSIVQEKIWSLSPFAVEMKFLVEQYAAGKGKCPPRKRRTKKTVFVCTIEKSLALIDSLIENDRANEIGLIVVDELHLLGEAGRGAILETVLAKTMFINAGIQIVGMSATIGNINEISRFLHADQYTRDFRPVELKEYIKCGTDILRINTKAAKEKEHAFIYDRPTKYKVSPSEKNKDPDEIVRLVMEVTPKNNCLIFCPTKKRCENTSLLLSSLLPKRFLEHRKSEKIELMKAIVRSTTSPLCNTLAISIPYGVAYHNSSLTTDERKYIEDAFRLGILCVICCTSTLAAGVNLPAQRVIIREPAIANEFITLSRYKQMVGRAGRAGLNDAGESYLICSTKDNCKVSALLCSEMDEVNSSLHLKDEKGIRCLVLNAIGLNLAVTLKDLMNLLNCTLLAVQAEKLNVNLDQLLMSTIEKLLKEKAIQINQQSIENDNQNISVGFTVTLGSENDQNNKKIVIKKSTPLQINSLGKAAVRACLDLNKAKDLYQQLEKAKENLILIDNLHLLYIITTVEQAESIQLVAAHYFPVYVRLTPKQLHTAELIGLTEAVAQQMARGKDFSDEQKIVLKRFYITLMLNDLWNGMQVFEVSNKYVIDRGIVQTLMTNAATNSANILRFCEEISELWAFKELLSVLTRRLSHCCSAELLPLMELPSVKLSRAKQLYDAGFKNLQLIAKATEKEIVEAVDFMNGRVARQIIAASKLLLLEKVETLRGEAQDVLDSFL